MKNYEITDPTGTLRERFEEKVNRTAGCWLWMGSRGPFGHGQIMTGKRPHKRPAKAHRVSLWLEGVEMPDGHEVHHKCHTPECVRPDHLEVLTPAEHRGRHADGCHKHGLSEWAEPPSGYRYCRICAREKSREFNANRTAEQRKADYQRDKKHVESLSPEEQRRRRDASNVHSRKSKARRRAAWIEGGRVGPRP